MEAVYLKRLIALAIRECDTFVVKILYEDKSGAKTVRVVSPIRLIAPDKFEALCLCREEPRHFVFGQVHDAVLVHSCDVLMPVEILEIPAEVPYRFGEEAVV